MAERIDRELLNLFPGAVARAVIDDDDRIAGIDQRAQVAPITEASLYAGTTTNRDRSAAPSMASVSIEARPPS